MALVGAYALPHPPLAIPGVGRGQERGIGRTLESFDEVSREIADLAPETIIFITPHNVIYADYFHISPDKSASGDFTRFGDFATRLEAIFDAELAEKISVLAELGGIPAGGLGTGDKKLDHGVTVPMWFIDRRYSGYKTVRISQSGMGPSEHYRLGRLIAEASEATGRKTVLIASSDMSHKLKADGPYGFAPEGPEFDGAAAQAMSDGDFLSLFNIDRSLRERAAECGYNSLMVLAGCFDKRRVDARLLSYEGPFGVGYAVASFKPGEPDESRNFLEQYTDAALKSARKSRDGEDEYRALARYSLEYTVKHGSEAPMPEATSGGLTGGRAGVFVSLYKDGALRGCVGTISPTTENIAREIIQNAVSAGLRDNRFEPVSEEELPYLKYKVDVLAAPEPIAGPEELDVVRYGVIVTSGHRRGLLLPNLDGVDSVDEQISIARRKAGIPEGTPVDLERFEVVRHE